MSDMPTAELIMRVQKAREFKARTCNGVTISPDLFGDKRDYATGNERFAIAAKRYRAEETPRQVYERTLKQIKATKRRLGGIFGVVEYKNRHGKTLRFEIRCEGRIPSSFQCPIDAAKAKNKFMAKRYPDEPDVLIDLHAVWDRWGCKCGKHERGKR